MKYFYASAVMTKVFVLRLTGHLVDLTEFPLCSVTITFSSKQEQESETDESLASLRILHFSLKDRK